MHTVKKGLNDITSMTSLSCLKNTIPHDDDAVSQKSKALKARFERRSVYQNASVKQFPCTLSYIGYMINWVLSHHGHFSVFNFG